MAPDDWDRENLIRVLTVKYEPKDLWEREFGLVTGEG